MSDEGLFALEGASADSGLLLRDYRRLTRLYCMNGGHHLQILPDGTVRGQRDDGDAHTFLGFSHYEVLKHVISNKRANSGEASGQPVHCGDLKRLKRKLQSGVVVEDLKIQIKAVDRGVVVIQGTETGRYLAMSDSGRLCSSPTVTDECYFLEKLEENHYNTYQPQKYQERNWYVGLKKNGKPKLGPRTHIGQKAVFFLPRRLDESGE